MVEIGLEIEKALTVDSCGVGEELVAAAGSPGGGGVELLAAAGVWGSIRGVALRKRTSGVLFRRHSLDSVSGGRRRRRNRESLMLLLVG
jgi:hypothetical protein